MEATKGKALENLIHDLNSKCSSLKGAAVLLREASEQEQRDLLVLIKKQAESLLEAITVFENTGS
ncbi:MAG: HAMP domain-containing histidine kinase [Elusimicrobia bacterium]|nr:HAMP domain-containing histidine kinase [Elusimicrobiota bacterium]